MRAADTVNEFHMDDKNSHYRGHSGNVSNVVTYRQFLAAYLSTLLASVALTLEFLPATLPSGAAVAMWLLVLLGVIACWRAHELTRRGVALAGARVESNPLARLFYAKGSQATLLVSAATQLLLGSLGTLYIFMGDGHYYYTLFLAGTVVISVFMLLDWYNDYRVAQHLQ